MPPVCDRHRSVRPVASYEGVKLFYSALRNRELSDRFFQTYAHENFELLSDFIRKGIEEGQFRAVEPVVAARSFLE